MLRMKWALFAILAGFVLLFAFSCGGGGDNDPSTSSGQATDDDDVATDDDASTDDDAGTDDDVAPGDAPDAPSELQATSVSSTQIDLTWVDNSDNEAGFLIQRKTQSSPAGAGPSPVGRKLLRMKPQSTKGTRFFTASTASSRKVLPTRACGTGET